MERSYTFVCTVVSATWGAILVAETRAPPEWLPIGVFFGGLFGVLVPGRMPRSWAALGLSVGAIVGYLIPTADVEHLDVFQAARDRLFHTVFLGVLGALVGAVTSCKLSECETEVQGTFLHPRSCELPPPSFCALPWLCFC